MSQSAAPEFVDLLLRFDRRGYDIICADEDVERYWLFLRHNLPPRFFLRVSPKAWSKMVSMSLTGSRYDCQRKYEPKHVPYRR